MRSSHLLSVLGFFTASLVVTGCSMTSTAVDTPVSGAALQGVLHGGQQGITASHIYVMQAGVTGYGGPSISLLLDGTVSGKDSIGNYVLSTPGGFFTIPTGSYACAPGTQVYLYALGGNPGAGTNSAAGLLAALGNCPSSQTLAAQTPQVLVNEVSTIAAAYAIAGYATDATHVSSSGSALAQIGIRNAFANAAQLVTLSSGIALTQTPNGNGTVPQTLIYTLANILAACVNSSGPTTGGCTGLFGAVKSGGLTGTTATDTATSAIYIAHSPGVNVGTLYPLASSQPPFSPAITGTTPPNDFTIGINYTGSGINHPEGIAIDTVGSAWIANTNGNSVTKLSPTGVPASGTPFTDSSIQAPQGIAIDTLGVAWVANYGSNSLTKISNSGSILASTTAGGNIALPGGVAIDSSNAAWVTSLAGGPTPALLDIAPNLATYTAYPVGVGGLNVTQGVAVDYTLHQWITNGSGTVTELLAGLPVLGTPYGTGTFQFPSGIAIDFAGNAWVADGGTKQVVKLTPGGGSLKAYTGGGLDGSIGIAIDGAQNIWLPSSSGINGTGVDGVSAFSNAGTPLSPGTGYLGGSIFFPYAVAIDGSGDVWLTSQDGPPVGGVPNETGSVTELIGAAIPVVTPLATSLVAPYSAPASQTLVAPSV